MEVADRVYLVKGWPWASDIYIIDENPLTLIDTGLPYKFKSLEMALSEIGKEIKDVGLILHTHGHIDHIGNTTSIKENSHAAVYGHKLDEDHFKGIHKYSSVKQLCGAIEGATSIILNYEFPIIDQYLFGGEDFDLLRGLKVIHTPGHTPGSVCYYSEKLGILFSGDTLQQRNGKIIKYHRFFYSEDAEAEEKSVEMLLQLEFDKLLAGHHQLLFKRASEKLRKDR